MIFLRLIFILFIPIFLYAATTSKLEVTQKSIDDQINEQIVVANEIIKKINNETITQNINNQKNFVNQINYLQTKITINKREKNDLAVRRDEIKLALLTEKVLYDKTLEEIVKAKKSFKDKEYFESILHSSIVTLENSPIIKYKNAYDVELTKDNKISKDFTKSYELLEEQNSDQLFTLRYLLNNIRLYRKTNFFIDEFNIQYIIKKIDSYNYISNASRFTSYYLKFSIGEIFLVIIILIFFRLINTKIITFLTNIILKKLFKKHIKKDDEEEHADLAEYIKKSIEKPLIYTLYTLAIQISIFILIKDTILISKIIPWINTLYMGLLTWAIYSLLSNGISNFAHSLVETHPNVRKEMIVFILRIIKIILVLIVVLFLFTQLGIDIKAIAASLGVGGIAIALASKDTLANFFGSLNIMSDNSFSQGDWIDANGVEGTVVDIRMRTTRIRTFDNAMITIPNSELANTHIKNYSKRRIGRRIKMTLNITYESKMSDIKKLKDAIYEMLNNHPDIANSTNSTLTRSKKFEVITKEDLQGIKKTLLVYIDEYDSSSVNILIYCFAKNPNWEEWLKVKEDVIIKINDLVHKNHCEFAYPTQTVFLNK